jgi:hypothetical protein
VPIPIDSIKTDFIAVSKDDLMIVLNKPQVDNFTYVVVAFDDGTFVIQLKIDLLFAASIVQGDLALLDVRIGDAVAGKPRYPPVDRESINRSEVQRLLKETLGQRRAVTSKGVMIGVIAIESRGISEMRAEASEPLPSLPPMSPPPPPPPPLPTSTPVRLDDGRSVSTSDWDRSTESLSPAPTPGAALAPVEKRWINAEILNHQFNAPLNVGQIYLLALDIDTEVRANSVTKDAAFTYQFGAAEESVSLTVQLSSSDFVIHSEPQQLEVTRSGKSKNRACFEIEPKHKGEGILNAIFLKDGNFIQLLTLRLNIDTPQNLSSRSMSRPPEAAFDVQPRDLGLVITNVPGAGFKLILTGPVTAEADLPLTFPELDQMITEVRTILRDIVNLQVGPQKTLIYQQGIDIPADVSAATLKQLAEAGYLLFQRIFFGPASDAQTRLLGDKLVEMSERQRLKIQVVSQQFLLPWGLLYLANNFDPDQIDPERFLGLKHIIEHIPLQPSMNVVDSVINSRPNLTISLNVNRDIDRQTRTTLIADQLSYWERISQRGVANVLVRSTGEELTKALATAACNEQILYFYCHAVSKGLSEAGGPGASSLQLGGAGVTLRDLQLRAPVRQLLSGAPLVFINACESAELSPLFYLGFVPYFMAKGARGVIGTECETPALFAQEWARRFFDSFLAGNPLGQIFLNLRRDFFFNHNNAMGLLYAVYCDGDTQVVPAVDVAKN